MSADIIPARLAPLLDQYDWACERLITRMAGPESDSGTGDPISVPPMTDEEYLWEPVPGCWSIRAAGSPPGPGAQELAGAGEWGRDRSAADVYPPPFTTIAWRLGHLSEMLTIRADHLTGTHALTRDDYHFTGVASDAVAAFQAGVHDWRAVLTGMDEDQFDATGLSTYPYGSDADDPFLEIVWWNNQEILHHGAEIALLRDLFRARQGAPL